MHRLHRSYMVLSLQSGDAWLTGLGKSQGIPSRNQKNVGPRVVETIGIRKAQ